MLGLIQFLDRDFLNDIFSYIRTINNNNNNNNKKAYFQKTIAENI